MKPFHSIAVPHKDILEGRLQMDVFAADLYAVSQNKGPDEYKDPDIFFDKTYLTEGLKNLLSVVEKRLNGKGGDPVIQLHTPFGGGKTHSLIAMYHKSKEWNANTVVLVGTELSGKDTLWGEIERQLTGKISLMEGNVSPGKQNLKKLFEAKQPILILMDEVLQYVTKAAGVRVGENNLASQTIAFMQELTETVASLEKVALVITLPSSIPEHYDENSEKLFSMLEHISRRVEKNFIPVNENEINFVIRRRLFASIDEKAAIKVVQEYINFLEKENILPSGTKPSEYKDKFINSYPFLPEVVDILYHRWGTFPHFQRTRGVLRLLSLVTYSVKDKNLPYISLADFDLSDQELRQELLTHIGSEFNGVIDADITGSSAGAKRVNQKLGQAYQGLSLGIRVATTIFMYSFSGGSVRGATLNEIKRSASVQGSPAPVIGDTVGLLEKELFYLQSVDNKYYFSNQPNLNRILLTFMENIRGREVKDAEKDLLEENIRLGKFNSILWEKDSSRIPDDSNLKLIVLPEKDEKIIREIIENKGNTPRVNRNTLIFVYPSEYERSTFIALLKRRIAYKLIKDDTQLNLSEEQKKTVQQEYRKAEQNSLEALRKFYKLVAVPSKEGFKEIDLGIPTYGSSNSLTEEIYSKLSAEGEILEKFAPIALKTKYLSGKEYVFSSQIYKATLTTPGEIRFINRGVLEKCIKDGVQQGMFGLGELINNEIVVHYFKKYADLGFTDKEIIITAEVCEQKERENEKEKEKEKEKEHDGTVEYENPNDTDNESSVVKEPEQLELKFVEIPPIKVPKGKVSSILGIMNYLQSKFEDLEIKIVAKEGSITKQEYEDKIKEALRQIEN